MLRFIAQSVLTLLGNAIGLLAAAWLLQDFTVNFAGFVTSIIFFTIAQILLAPFIFKMAVKYIPAFRGGIALVTAFVVLALSEIFTKGLHISGLTTWIVAPLTIWLTSVLAGIFLPMVLFKKVLNKAKQD